MIVCNRRGAACPFRDFGIKSGDKSTIVISFQEIQVLFHVFQREGKPLPYDNKWEEFQKKAPS